MKYDKRDPEEQPPIDKATGRPVAEAQALPPTFTNTIGMAFVLIPAGRFEMGSDNDEREQPVHRVTISKPFYLSTYQTTQRHWKRVMGSNPSRFSGDDDLPVEMVSWDDAQDFIRRLNDLEGAQGWYRLPTEAEWEYACRAGTTGAYAGDLEAMAWYRENAENRTHPVGEKKPNTWGVYDMHGNVWEWVQDWYGAYPAEALTDPTGPETGLSRVFRGGSFSNTARDARSAFRFISAPTGRYFILGFRLVRMPL